MKSTLFLYVDILGFSGLIKTPKRVEKLYDVLDEITLHRDPAYRAIVFSDTILAYHRFDGLPSQGKKGELMFLIELVQDLHIRLVGSKIFFRAIITEGEFYHEKMINLEKFYGPALVDCYNDEKALIGAGLFLDVALRDSNQIFRCIPFSKRYDFVLLTHQITKLISMVNSMCEVARTAVPAFPLSEDIIYDTDREYDLYPEIVHLQEVYDLMRTHLDPGVRAKFLSTWQMYVQAYPGLTESLITHGMKPDGLVTFDWAEAEKHYKRNSAWRKRGVKKRL
jgi:hypothetical protein